MLIQERLQDSQNPSKHKWAQMSMDEHEQAQTKAKQAPPGNGGLDTPECMNECKQAWPKTKAGADKQTWVQGQTNKGKGGRTHMLRVGVHASSNDCGRTQPRDVNNKTGTSKSGQTQTWRNQCTQTGRPARGTEWKARARWEVQMSGGRMSTRVRMSMGRYKRGRGGSRAMCPWSLVPLPLYLQFFNFPVLFKYFYVHILLYLDYCNEK